MRWLREVMKILWGNMVLSRLQSQITVPHTSATSIGKKHCESSKRDMRFLQSETGLAFLNGAEHLFTETWQQSQTDVSLKWSHFLADLNKLIEQNASILKQVSRKTSPWFNNNLRKMINKGKRVCKKYSADRLAKSCNNFRLFRSEFTKPSINRSKYTTTNFLKIV